MLIVSLTGGIATGKSTVASVFENLGCFIHHADRAAHALMEPGRPVWDQIVQHFGRSILKESGVIDRAKLGKIIFSNTKERQHLNSLIHPYVHQQRKDLVEELKKKKSTKIFVSEAALTIEAGYATFFDKIVLTHCPEEVQIERLIDRNRMSRSEALARMGSQLPAQEKIKWADYVIDTSHGLSRTLEEAERVYRNLVSDYEQEYGP